MPDRECLVTYLEKRIFDIYQRCRTSTQIDADFKMLQLELDGQINDRIKETRMKLLENLDDEVVQKLRLRNSENVRLLGKYESWLWLITKYYLRAYARFDEGEAGGTMSFFLEKNPFPGEVIHPGPYRITRDAGDANRYRLAHPLAQRIISQCLVLATPPEGKMIFGYSASGKIIRDLENLKGKSGWLRLTRVSVSSTDVEEHLIFSGITDDGEPLDMDQCRRLFILPAVEADALNTEHNDAQKGRLDELLEKEMKRLLCSIYEKNKQFLHSEREKYVRWSKDRQKSLKEWKSLNGIEEEIQSSGKMARRATSMADKLRWSGQRRKLEEKREEAWKRHRRAALVVEARKEEMLRAVEERLNAEITEMPIFTLRWKML